MPAQNASISFRSVNIFSLSTLIPTYGNFCGPEWSAGTRKPVSQETFDDTLPIMVTLANGSKRLSVMDTNCKVHDKDYIDAEGQKNQAELIAQADMKFIKATIASYDSLTPTEKYYAALAIPAFASKYATWDQGSFLFNSLKTKINEAIAEFNKKSDLPKEVSLTDSEGNTLSRTTDADGNVTLSYTTKDQSQSITLDETMQATSASQKFFDESGKLAEETRIELNNSAEISQVTHATNGNVDAEGVIIGKMSQEKLDQFFDLANTTVNDGLQPDTQTGIPLLSGDQVSVLTTSTVNASHLLDAMNVHVGDQNAAELDDWFTEADPIRLQAYHWDHEDKNLQNLWMHGNDTTLAAYDLQSVMDANHAEWNADLGGWGYSDSAISVNPLQISSDETSSFEYSLSDIDLGLDTHSLQGYDYTPAGWWNDNAGSSQDWSNSYIDPLVVRIGQGSVHTTNLEGSTVMFDMQANGKKVRTGWITPDHAFLVRDRNHNGIIDDSSEMFSERTSPKAATGFAALAQLDSRRDGWIDYRDKAFKELRLWTDINADGITQKGELQTLDRFGIRFFVVAQPVAKNVYDNGNLILNTNQYHSETGRGIYTGEIAEVLFNFGDTKPVTSIYLSDQATAIRTSEGKTLQVLSDKNAQTINASMSGINLLVGGKGDVLNAGNARQSLLIGNGGTTMNGNAGSTHFVVNGTGNTVNTGTGDSFIQVNGDANTINAAKGDVQMDVDGSRNKITLGSNDVVNLGGTANTLTAAGNGKDNRVVISGQNETVNLSNSDVALLDNASVTLNGKNNDITQEGHSTLSGTATGGTLLVRGDGNVATVSSAFIGLAAGAELQLTGKNVQVVMAGDGDLVFKGSAAGSSVNVYGEDNKVNMTGGAVRMAEGASLDLAGRGNAITMLGDADLTARDKGQRIDVYGAENHAAVSGSTIIEHGLADLDIDGNANGVRNTPTRPDLLKKEVESEMKAEQQMDAVWAQYQQLQDISIGQQWRQWLPDALPVGLQTPSGEPGYDSGFFSGNHEALVRQAGTGLAPPLLVASTSAAPGGVARMFG